MQEFSINDQANPLGQLRKLSTPHHHSLQPAIKRKSDPPALISLYMVPQVNPLNDHGTRDKLISSTLVPPFVCWTIRIQACSISSDADGLRASDRLSKTYRI